MALSITSSIVLGQGLMSALLVLHCTAGRFATDAVSEGPPAGTGGPGLEEFSNEREAMVRSQIEARGVRDSRVLAAMRKIRRHDFVPSDVQTMAYGDTPLPIGFGQTISQPYVVAFMSEALELKPEDRVLEIGTGSGYQAAVLALLARDVYSIEIVEPLAKQAQERLERLRYTNVHVRAGDGYGGWPEAAPFDAIIVTAAPDHVPQALVDQLREGGRLVLPLGRYAQELIRIRRTRDGTTRESLLPVRFVPMTGEAEKTTGRHP